MTKLAAMPIRDAHHSKQGQRAIMTALQTVPEVWLELTQTWLYNQITYLPEEIQSHVLCERTENLDHFPFPRIHALESESAWRRRCDRVLKKLRVRRYLGHARRVVKQVRPQVIHSHFGPTGWEMLPVAQASGARHLVTFYGLDVNFLPRQGWAEKYQQLFREIDMVLCEGPHMAKCIVELGCNANKVQVHHLGVRVDQIEFMPRQWKQGERLRVLMAASFREKKGLPDAITALGLVKDSVDFEGTIIGGASNSPQSRAEEQRILQAIEKYGLGDRIRMLGFQPAHVLMEESLKHHVFLSPSVTASDGDTEGGAPVTIIEMAASGMPIVSTTHCDIPEVIENEVGGLLTPEREPAALAKSIERLVCSPQRWNAMLAAARRRIEEQFDARTQGQLLARRYQSCQ